MNRHFHGVPFALGVAVALLAAPVALGAEVAKGNRPSLRGDQEEVQVDASGATVAVEKGGKLRAPTREEAAVLLEAMGKYLDQSSAGLQVKTLSDGTKTVDLQDRFQDLSLAKIEGGKVVTTCVGTRDEAKVFLERKGTAAPVAKSSRQPASDLEEK